MTFSLIFLLQLPLLKLPQTVGITFLSYFSIFFKIISWEAKKVLTNYDMLDTFVGKKIHTLKNKQTSKQKQEEDRKSIEKIKCSFWLENLRKFEKIWKFWKFVEIVIRLRVKKPHYSKTSSKLQGLSWHVLLRRLERYKIRFAQSFYQICHPHVLTWSCSISSRGIRFSNSSRYLI